MAIHDAYRATINGTGDTADETMTVGVEAAHADQDGKQFRAIGFIDGGDGLHLDAAGLRRLIASFFMPPSGLTATGRRAAASGRALTSGSTQLARRSTTGHGPPGGRSCLRHKAGAHDHCAWMRVPKTNTIAQRS